MKPIKMFGLAALAALLAMAFVGATSAMAESTALCKVDETTCSESNEITSVHETTVAGSPAELLTNAGTVTCDVLFSGTVADGSAAPQVISGNFTYSNCKRNGTESCTVEEKNGPVEIQVLKEGHETGSVTGKGEVNVHCGSFINCTYNGTGLKGTAKGPLLSTKTNGSVELSEQTTNHVSGLFCPATAKLDITTTPLVATSIVGNNLVLLCVEILEGLGKFKNPGCTEVGVGNQNKYVKGWVRPNTGLGTAVCIYVGPNILGLYLRTNAGLTSCEAADALSPMVGEYEKGPAQ